MALVDFCHRRHRANASRPNDIMYRAWEAEPWLGRFGALKTEVGVRARQWAERSSRSCDFGSSSNGHLRGNDWLIALSNAKATVGVEGGSSIFDFEGNIRLYQQKLQDDPATAQILLSTLLASDGKFGTQAALSPRHMEAALTKTLQFLIEGEYSNVLRSGEHYVSLRSDFDGLEYSMNRIDFEDDRRSIVDAAYGHIADTGCYRWDYFVRNSLSEAV
jgi:hypothetical protein